MSVYFIVDLIFIGDNLTIFESFKQTMLQELHMTEYRAHDTFSQWMLHRFQSVLAWGHVTESLLHWRVD